MADWKKLVAQLDDGRKNAQSAPKLEGALGMPSGHTQEPTRALIKSAITDQNIPIGSGHSGYFLVDTQGELDQVVADLQDRIDGIQARIDGLQRGWAKRQQSRAQGKNWPK